MKFQEQVCSNLQEPAETHQWMLPSLRVRQTVDSSNLPVAVVQPDKETVDSSNFPMAVVQPDK